MAEIFGGFPLTWPLGVKRLNDWNRVDSKFKTGFGAARDRLLSELNLLGVARHKGVVISSNVPLRQDGLPYAGQANPKDPAVAVYFWLDNKQRVFGCDRYRKVADNLYAVTLTIEALRGIRRWGTSQMFEQAFTGFAALPPPPKQPAPCGWAVVLGIPPQMERSALNADFLRRRRNELAMRFHPDNGTEPDAGMMAEVNRAYDQAVQALT